MSHFSFADDDSNTVFHCTSTNGTQKSDYAISKGTSNPATFVVTKLISPSSSSSISIPFTPTELRILGKTNLNKKYGNLVGADPVVAWVATQKIGDSYLNLSFQKKEGVYHGEFKSGYQYLNLTCTEGKAFSSYQVLAEAAPLLDVETVGEYGDAFLALSCHLKGETKVAYQLRAFHSSYANGSLQINDLSDSRFGSIPSFQSLTFGRKKQLIFKTEDRYNVFTGNTLPRLYFNLKTHRHHDQRLHEVTWVRDLHNPDLPMIDLVCAERQAYSTLELIAKEEQERPKTLPSLPGTLAQVDPSLCGKDNDKGQNKAILITDKWGYLIGRVKLPSPHSITMVSHNLDRTHYCFQIEVQVSSSSAIDAAKAILGESLEGVQIAYTVQPNSTPKGDAYAQ